jgi:hypothetical protein
LDIGDYERMIEEERKNNESIRTMES